MNAAQRDLAQAFPKLPAEEMELARQHAKHARILLRYIYQRVESHTTLRMQAETAGKCVKQLIAALEAREKEWRGRLEPLS